MQNFGKNNVIRKLSISSLSIRILKYMSKFTIFDSFHDFFFLKRELSLRVIFHLELKNSPIISTIFINYVRL